MDTNALQMDENVQTLRGEMQRIGRGLQAGMRGITAIVCSETRTASEKKATPRAGASELRESATAVRPAMETGEVMTSLAMKSCLTHFTARSQN